MEDEVTKDDVEKIIFRLKKEINDLREKMNKYIEDKQHEIDSRQNDLRVLEKLVKKMPEIQPKLFDQVK
jgi:flagellar motility protein MotE (MotC chaperone)